jgi:hypothetical protein
MKEKAGFVYLDAHWNADLPLADELDVVFNYWPAAVIMIDDFQVPDDVGYSYDDYGQGKALTAAYIAPAVTNHFLQTLYPAAGSTEESGARRGSVVPAKADIHGAALRSCRQLREISTEIAPDNPNDGAA